MRHALDAGMWTTTATLDKINPLGLPRWFVVAALRHLLGLLIVGLVCATAIALQHVVSARERNRFDLEIYLHALQRLFALNSSRAH